MEILILGGTGAMGDNLVKLLRESNHNVCVTSRSLRKSYCNIRFVQGNAKDKLFLEKILNRRWDVIIDFMVYATNEFNDRIDLLLKCTSQYFFISSARVYADSIEPITECSIRLLDISNNEEFLSTDEYSLAKARQEDILKNSGRKNWTIIRPYITYDNYRLQLGILEKEDWLYRALKCRTIIFSKDINEKFTTMTYGLDVAYGIISLMGKMDVLGETYHITNNDSIRWSEVLWIYIEVLEEYLGKRPKVILEDLETFLIFHPATFQIKYDRLYNRQFHNSKIANHILVDRFTSTQEGIRQCLKEFLLKPEFKTINWKSEALKDRRTKERASLLEINGLKQKFKYLIYRYLIN